MYHLTTKMLPLIISVVCVCLVVLIILYFSRDVLMSLKPFNWNKELKTKMVDVELGTVNDLDNDDADPNAPVAPVCGVDSGADASDSDYE